MDKLNGFALMAKAYRKLVESGEVPVEFAKRRIEVYDFLATCNVEDFCLMVDSSAFNDIIRAFLRKAIIGAGLDKKAQEKMLRELVYIFDGATAEEVLLNDNV